MRKVVINSTPLLVLGNIGRLDILRELYGKIYIAEAVFKLCNVSCEASCRRNRNNDPRPAKYIKC